MPDGDSTNSVGRASQPVEPRVESERTGKSARPTWLRSLFAAACLLLALAISFAAWPRAGDSGQQVPAGRREVVFWHFWGGKDRPVVEAIVDRFNASQNEHFVRAIAMPGSNGDVKFFLSVAGGDPPDVVNQDDPIVADWAARGALTPLDELGTPAEAAALKSWLYPAALALGSYRNRLYALCNGLDIRALYYDEDVLDKFGLKPPQTLDDLDAIAERIVPPGTPGPIERYGFLPDPRRIWAWGIVFGGRFYDPATAAITSDGEPIQRACEWMESYGKRYGHEQLIRFRKADQALPGAAFPLLERRYAIIMDGQWRVAEIAAAVAAARREKKPEPRIGAIPLPPPQGGLERAGWVNGNFFVVPRGCKNAEGAWQFMKFWSGFGGNAANAAAACARGLDPRQQRGHPRAGVSRLLAALSALRHIRRPGRQPQPGADAGDSRRSILPRRNKPRRRRHPSRQRAATRGARQSNATGACAHQRTRGGLAAVTESRR